jgi:hypothetical protein
MSFVDGHPHPKDATFAPAILGAFQPEQIVAWMKKKAYGTLTPSQNDRPTVGHLSSHEYYNKALSHYMPNKLWAWNALSQQGNPTRSLEVNTLIKMVKNPSLQAGQSKQC